MAHSDILGECSRLFIGSPRFNGLSCILGIHVFITPFVSCILFCTVRLYLYSSKLYYVLVYGRVPSIVHVYACEEYLN